MYLVPPQISTEKVEIVFALFENALLICAHLFLLYTIPEVCQGFNDGFFQELYTYIFSISKQNLTLCHKISAICRAVIICRTCVLCVHSAHRKRSRTAYLPLCSFIGFLFLSDKSFSKTVLSRPCFFLSKNGFIEALPHAAKAH